MYFMFRRRRKKLQTSNLPDSEATSIGELVHEIRNPLNSISANLQLLEEDIHRDPSGFNGDDFLKRLRLVRKELNRLEQVLNDFLRFARLPPLKLESNDLRAVLDEVLDFIEPEAQRHEIKVRRNFEKPIPKFQFDKIQVKQAILNLILNANQSMPNGGELTVSASSELSGCWVKISVSDTGCGIKDEVKEKLFDLFFSTKKDGTGLGLNIVKKIADQHGGKVEFTTELGKGTTFYLFLPL